MKKAELMKQCKEQGIKGYSTMKKEELISTLEESGIKNTYVEVPKKEKKEAIKKTTKPRLDKLSKKLEKFVTMETYKNELSKFNEDVADEDLLDIVTESMKNFIISDSVDDVDYRKYVTTYGPIKALVEYLASPDAENINTFTEQEMFEKLAVYIYFKDTEITGTLYKKIRKLIATNSKGKKPIKKTTKYIEEPSDEESDDASEAEADDDNDDNDDVDDDVGDDDEADDSDED